MIPVDSPPTRLETWLNTMPADHLAALFLGVCVLAFAVGMAVSIARRLRTEPAAHRTQPASSNRKAGRTRGA